MELNKNYVRKVLDNPLVAPAVYINNLFGSGMEDVVEALHDGRDIEIYMSSSGKWETVVSPLEFCFAAKFYRVKKSGEFRVGTTVLEDPPVQHTFSGDSVWVWQGHLNEIKQIHKKSVSCSVWSFIISSGHAFETKHACENYRRVVQLFSRWVNT